LARTASLQPYACLSASRTDRRTKVLGQLVEDVPRLVRLTALDQCPPAEDLAHGLGQRLRAVEDCEHRPVGPYPALAQIAEERRACRGVLRGAFADAEYVLLPVGVDSQRRQDHVLVDVDTVDHQHHQVDLAEVASHPRRHLVRGGTDEAAADGAPARAARAHAGRHVLQRPRVPPRGDAYERLRHGPLVERIFRREGSPAGQRHLAALDGARPWTLDLYPPPAEHQLAKRMARTKRPALRLVHVPRPAHRGPLLLEQARQRCHPGVDHEVTQISTDDRVQQRQQPASSRRCSPRSLPGTLLHRRLLVGGTPRILSGRLGPPLQFQQEPGLRRQYHASFVIDPDGNNIEAVCCEESTNQPFLQESWPMTT
jgi:hypothetical protein